MRTSIHKRVLWLMLFVASVSMQAAVLDFESFNDGDVLTNQIAGVVFTNTVVLSSGASLPDAAPPRSGTNVGVDLGPIEISFAAPISSFSGYFTYLSALTITAYDTEDAVIDVATSAFNANFIGGDPGSSPNEFLIVSGSGIARVTLLAGADGSSLTMDDLEVLTGTAIPEPSTAGLAALGLGGAMLARRWRSRRS